MEFKMNIFTFNCWGIPFISKNRKERIEALAQYLATSKHEVVCLQEIWSEKDYLFLKDRLKSILPYSHYFYSGVIGSGLCVFSKWIIQDVFFHQWPLNGYIHKVHHGDWFGGKGVALCRIKCDNKLINVYCTHLHAQYHKDDIYLAHRVLQAYSTAEFIKLTSHAADISILAGDLNTTPGELSYKIITELATLVDPYQIIKSHETNTEVKTFGTSDAANNSYSDPTLVTVMPEGKRIDYILFKHNDNWEAKVLQFENPLEDRVPGKDFSYSDHNAVAVELVFRPCEIKMPQKTVNGDCSLNNTIFETVQVCKEASQIIAQTKTLYLTIGGLIFMFLIGSVGYWPNSVLFDIIKIIITSVSLYYIAMGTLWNKIEMNSIKAGLTALESTYCYI